MWILWNKHAPVRDRASEGENGGSGGDQGGDTSADNGAAGGDGEGAAGDPGTSSILDMATRQTQTQGEGESWAAPEGLPDHLKGEGADDTLQKVLKAYQGARRELSQGKKGQAAEDLPESPDGYVFEPSGDDDKIAAELNSEASKPIVDQFRKAALKAGIGQKQFESLMREGLGGVAEMGIPLGASNEEAQQISGEAEMQKLTEIAGGPREASTVVNTLSTYGQKLVDRGTMSKDDMQEFAVMVGTAESASLFYKILTAELGEKPIPMAIGGEGSMSGTDAYAAYSAALRMTNGAERDAALEKAQAAMQRAFGNEGAGSVRSSVL